MRAYCLTDTGLKRSSNQDFVYASEQKVGALASLFMVADGMGGHNAGDLASRLCVETMVETISNSSLRAPVPILREAIDASNRAVSERAASDRNLAGMGTTLVCAVLCGDTLYAANVGDSRLYILDDATITQISHDHSLVEEMVRAGRLKPEQARSHPEKNIITRAIGESEQVQADFFDVAVGPGDEILLCSDGLTNMVEDDEILRIVRRESSPEEAAVKLIEAANRAGGKDNISVVLVEV